MSTGLLGFIKGCKLTNFKEVVMTDYCGYIINLNINNYFNINTSIFDTRDYDKLDLTRRFHREKFINYIKKMVEQVDLEKHIKDLENQEENLDKFKMKLVDEEFTYIFNNASLHVIRPKLLPPTETKLKLISNVLYWKARI